MTKLSVPEMSCNCCKSSIEKIVKGIDASARIEFDLETHLINIECNASEVTLISALKEKGYEASVV
ncbi:MAG: heavy-metal-associated domain-containing protein [Rhizobiales bacterium]|nr:cation transporter [Hyphomicrobiales bacterium]NRB15736.1 heavy-metal-associated domain-containing protein [Hyphomicrobiales bacterium]